MGILLAVPALAFAQERGNPEGEWRYQSGDAWGTRYSPLDQIDASNFEDLEVAWIWRGDNFSPHPLYLSRSTPSYIDGILYTRISDWLWYFCPCDQSSRLDFRGFLERNQATEGDTQWVNYKPRPFSSRSTGF